MPNKALLLLWQAFIILTGHPHPVTPGASDPCILLLAFVGVSFLRNRLWWVRNAPLELWEKPKFPLGLSQWTHIFCHPHLRSGWMFQRLCSPIPWSPKHARAVGFEHIQSSEELPGSSSCSLPSKTTSDPPEEAASYFCISSSVFSILERDCHRAVARILVSGGTCEWFYKILVR